MLPSSADYKTAIASTDREIRGYLQFSNGFILRGSGGLISFKSTQTAMEAERFCVGSVTSAYCEASFYNSGLDGSGVSLANSYFDAYIGVCTDEPDSPDVDLKTVTVYENGSTTVTPIGKKISDMNGVASVGSPVTVTANGVEYHGTVVLNGTLLEVNFDDATDFTLEQKLDFLVANWYIYCDPIYVGDLKIDVGKMCVEYVCCGRYWVSEITRTAKTTNIAGYDVAGRLSMNYVCTVTPDPDDGYLVMDVLNDIIDQTGVNGGTHFTTFGDSVYVPEIYEGNCRQQWGWLCTLARTEEDGAEWSGTRETADLGYMKAYYLGNGELNPYSMTDDVIYLDGLNVGDTFTINSFTTGTTENPIVAGNGVGVYGLNPYIDQTLANAIEANLDNFTYTPVTLHWRGDPCIDVMDKISITTGAGDTYTVVAMKITTTFNGGLEQTINCWGDSEAFYELSTSPTDSKINTVSNMLKEIAQSIETADGGVITKILDTDGSWKELVIANNQDLDQATSVWRWNINGLAHSTQYSGGTYSFALDDQGRLIANVIQTGILQDALGNNSWNLDTGALTITDGSINITTSNENNDLIQFNGDSRNAQGLGSTFYSQMTPTSHLVHRDNYTLSTHSATTVSVNAGSVWPLYVQSDVYSNVQPDEIYSTTRGVLTGTSVDFYQAVGIGAEEKLVSALPNGVEFDDDVTPYNSRCTITYKKCRKFGNFRFIRLLLSSSHTGSNSPRLASVGAGNAPQFANALTCVTYVSDSDVGTAIPCMIGTSGGIYLKSTSSGTDYLVTGYYIVS